MIEATLAMGEPAPIDEGVGGPSDGNAPSGKSISVGALFGLPYKDARASVLAEFERAYLTDLVEKAEGNVSKAAREASMDRSHLWDMLRRHKLR